jgi:hypothetical protein
MNIPRKIKTTIQPRKYNTCNAWGFGGSFGKEWVFPNGWKYRHGTASTRHCGTSPVRYALNEHDQKVTLEEFLNVCAAWIY